jgi:1,4-dihydroxy-2-naphthoyl-CoA hydrolase
MVDGSRKARGLSDAGGPLRAPHVLRRAKGAGMDKTIADQIKGLRLPFADLLGITLEILDADRIVAKMLVRDDLCTLGRTLHGGAVMALADTAGAVATFVNLPEGARGTTTLESKTNFVSPAPAGMVVTATATPVHRGRRTQVWQTRIETQDGKLVALVTQTQMVL